MRILFVTSNRMGDAVLSTGLLDHLIRTHHAARITVVCGPVAEGVFMRMPNRERTIVLTKRPGNLHWLALWREVVRRRWDLVVDIRGGALGFVVPTRRRAVFRRRPGPKVRELGAILRLDPAPLPVAWTGAEDQARAAALLPAHRPVIALGPTAAWPPKAWPADRFAALYHALEAGPLPGAIPAVFCGPGAEERAMAAPLLAALPGAVDLCGRLTLPEVVACFQRSAIFIGNDSGLMHLAAATAIPTLGLFGPTSVHVYAPAGPRAGVAVSPTELMTDLGVDAAFEAARALLAPEVASAKAEPYPASDATRIRGGEPYESRRSDCRDHEARGDRDPLRLPGEPPD